MEISSKKLARTSKIIYFAISLLLCGFLILLTNKIMSDIERITTSPQITDFENKELAASIQKLLVHVDDTIKTFENSKSQIEKAEAIALSSYSNEKESFDNWISARKTIGSPSNDKEVIERARKLDNIFKIEKAWKDQLAMIDDKIKPFNAYKDSLNNVIQKDNEKAQALYSTAMHKYDIKVFLIRLLFVLPILLLGVLFFIRLRKNKFWPLYQGFTLFSLYAFFFGLVPYLPSYGGYIRYSVGIILCIFAGYYAITRIRKYLDQKRAELEASSKERAKKVETGTAEKALNTHVCPSCGKDFILKNWEHITETVKNSIVITDFCRFCGMELFAKCNKCGNKNFVHLPYCSTCGEKIKNTETAKVEN
jgi:hypothetical protein